MSIEAGDDFYPGSTEVRRSAGGPGRTVPEPEQQEWEELGREYVDGRRRVRLYPISALASALDRSPLTIRHWDQKGIIPKANSYTDSRSEHGRRRLYTHAQISGLQQIAQAEGLMAGKKVFISHTQFTDRAFLLFEQLEEQ